MAEVMHTPGPWTVPHFARPEVNCACGYVLTDGLMGAVCTVHASGEGDWRTAGDNPKFEEACANARLIAAAPDLYAAAKEAQREESDPQELDDDAEVVALTRATFDALMAAIAKAEGL